MHPTLLASHTSMIVIIIILVQIPKSLCADDQQYSNCSNPFHCANIQNIGYPFWGGYRSSYCGYGPEFELLCHGDAPLITILNTTYRVLAIDNSTQTLTTAREDFWNNTCPGNLRNATLDIGLFNYTSNTQNLWLYYDCSSIPDSPNQSFNCSGNGTTSGIGYYSTGNSTPINSGTCNFGVTVRVFQSAVQALANSTLTSSGLLAALDGGFGLQWFANDILCERCSLSGGQCGHNQTNSSEFTCHCPDQPQARECSLISGSNSDSKLGIRLGTGLAGSLVSMITTYIIVAYCRGKRCKAMVFRKMETENDPNVEEMIRNYGSLAPKRFNYSDVKKMTNSFKNKLGQGGYGGVFKGKLPDGRLMAVKVLSETKGNGEEFINEVASISRTSHINVVTLLGFCYENNKRALIYEFMPNGSLDKFICKEGSLSTNHHLESNRLYQIAVGTARGLEYLHRGCNTRIVHFDIKPHNILLDDDFCPKISDFGLAKLCQRKESIVSMLGPRGTIGYIAPEVFCRNFGGVSHKSDVYSYGMMVLEMVGGRQNTEQGSLHTSETYFPDWIYEHLEHGKDILIQGVKTEEEEEITRKMILVSLWCIQTNPSDRPSISKVLEMLEGSSQSLQIPPKPFLYSPTRSNNSTQDSSVSLV